MLTLWTSDTWRKREDKEIQKCIAISKSNSNNNNNVDCLLGANILEDII